MNNLRKFYFTYTEVEDLNNFADPKRDDRQQKQTEKIHHFKMNIFIVLLRIP